MYAKKSKNRTIIKNQSSLPDLTNGRRVLFTRCRSSISHQLFFPWILSFIPHLAYPLNKEEVQSLAPSDLSKALNKKDTQKKGLASAFGGGATAMLLSKAFPI